MGFTLSCTLYIISFGNFMINVKCAKNATDSTVWFTDTSGLKNEHAISGYVRSATSLIQIESHFQTNQPGEESANTFTYTPLYIFICTPFWRCVQL